MFDIFLQGDMCELLKKKSVVFMGDSNIRALYKDFLCLLHKTQFISDNILRNKMEKTVFGDKLVFHGLKSNGRNYREEREATIQSTKVSFFFLTKVFDDYVKKILKRITDTSNPDVIIINCCLWDITRWGCDGVKKYKENLKLLMKELKKYVPDCLVIWITAPPIACEVKGGFLVKELQFLKYSLRFHVVEANHYARKIVVENGFDVMDSHYHLKMQIHRRSDDGIHWLPPAVRYVTNLLLTHISLAWNVPLPHRCESTNFEKNLILATDDNNVGVNKSKIKEEVIEVTFKDSAAPHSSERNEENSKNKCDSILRPKVKKKNETIHAHMNRIQKEKRRKRIRRWRQPNIGDSPAHHMYGSYQSNHCNVLPFISPPYGPGYCEYNSNFPSIMSPSQIPLPSYSPSYFTSDNFPCDAHNIQGNFRQSNFMYNNVQCFNSPYNFNSQYFNHTNNHNAYFDFTS
ncbi:PC-esterase domain-containing protein 1A [Nephila pilipes]|uniref:PC-esterase domain-containing protein 1A n=1 Tax=Nephila pilipes TaxID=299642 RepID=A0A8X6P8C9_NEPPI|nr:PC-esterase domain-containing protein 1A [Nephila pilipes]